MKTLKSLFSIILITFSLLVLTSCGDESEDPTPTTPTNQLSQFDGSWKFESLTVDGIVFNPSQVCDATGVYKDAPKWNFDNVNTTTKRMNLNNSCSDGNNFQYDVNVTKNGSTYTIEISDTGMKLFGFTVTSITTNKLTVQLTFSSSSGVTQTNLVSKGAVFVLVK